LTDTRRRRGRALPGGGGFSIEEACRVPRSSCWRPRRGRRIAIVGLLVAPLIFGAPSIPAIPAATGLPPRANCSGTSVETTPLTDLDEGTYGGFRGGLYPKARNRAPLEYRRKGIRQAGKIEPLNAAGDPSSRGSIVLMSVGMSNTGLEFQAFMGLAREEPGLNPDLALVQGAQGGWDATEIADPNAEFWQNIDAILADDGLTRRQVQAVWLKEAVAGERRSFPEDALALKELLGMVVDIMKDRYPNLRIVYVSSRTYAGYATTGLNPEPFAYESGFAVKWLVRGAIRRDRPVRPWVAWGPYLWTNGTRGRDDGLVWTCDDVAADGTHPSETGQRKIGDLLLQFFSRNRTAASWFLG
jgi:hypothetical protein